MRRIDGPADPERCQSITAVGQCGNKVVPNTNFCENHGGCRAEYEQKQKSLRIYRLQQYQERVSELSDHAKAKTLREELGILRILLETVVNDCNGDNKVLLMNSSKISDLVVKIEKVTSSCQRLEFRLGDTLDKTKVIQFADEMVEIISKYITDPKALSAISEELVNSLESLSPLNE